MITMSAIMVTLFFGGPDGPGFHFVRWLWPIAWFAGKTVVFLYVYVWIRAALPRLRYDQLMDLGWKVLIPFSLGVAPRRRGFSNRDDLGRRGLPRFGRRRRWAVAGRPRRPCPPRGARGELAQAAPADGGRFPPAGGARAGRRRVMARKPRKKRSLGFFGGFAVTLKQVSEPRVTTPTRTRSCPSRRACTAATSSTATRTAWRSASAASCARLSARRTASTCGAPTTRPTRPVSPGERYGFVYEINYLRCIHCDLCVEACPTEAITETKLFEFSFTNRSDAIYTKERAPRRRRRPAPSAAVGGLARRARTSTRRAGCGRPRRPGPPSTKDAVQWSGELGYGVRPPEGGQSAGRDDAATGNISIRTVERDKIPRRFGGKVRGT